MVALFSLEEIQLIMILSDLVKAKDSILTFHGTDLEWVIRNMLWPFIILSYPLLINLTRIWFWYRPDIVEVLESMHVCT